MSLFQDASIAQEVAKAAPVTMNLARHGVGNWDFALGVTESPG